MKQNELYEKGFVSFHHVLKENNATNTKGTDQITRRRLGKGELILEPNDRLGT